jgi:ribonuclease D
VGEENVAESLEQICAQKVIGIDTESRVARTSLDRSLDVLATVQIATPTKVFIFDALALKKVKTVFGPIEAFFKDNDVTVVGHTLGADLNGDVTGLFGYKGEVKCRRVDVSLIFKILYPKENMGLANVCKVLLGKELCKKFTMTNWNRRPLYRNQLHYAALDSVVVLEVW